MTIHLGDGFAGLAALPADSAELVFCDPVWGVPIDTQHKGAAKWKERLQRGEEAEEMFWETSRFKGTIISALRVAPSVIFKFSGRPNHLLDTCKTISDHDWGFRDNLAYMFTWDKGPGYPSACNGGISESRESLWWFTRDGSLKREAEWNKGFQCVVRERGDPDPDTDGILRFPKVRDEDRLTPHVFEMSKKLCEWITKVFTLPGDTIVDPCCGSGALLAYAQAWGRKVIGWEIDPEMADAARAALADPRPLVERATPDLFGETT